VKLAEAYGAKGIRCEKPGELDAAIQEMMRGRSDQHLALGRDDVADLHPGLSEIVGQQHLVMRLARRDHREAVFLLLSDYLGETGVEIGDVISAEGKMLV
jgi:acetolactate synthase-1/2/3 large subunit